jgi:hypothetical protein
LSIDVTVADELSIDIIDDGCGIPADTSGEAVWPICVDVPSRWAAPAASLHRQRAEPWFTGRHRWWISESDQRQSLARCRPHLH